MEKGMASKLLLCCEGHTIQSLFFPFNILFFSITLLRIQDMEKFMVFYIGKEFRKVLLQKELEED